MKVEDVKGGRGLGRLERGGLGVEAVLSEGNWKRKRKNIYPK